MQLRLSKAIVWSTAVQIVGKVLQMGLGILTVKLITNALGTENYGIYGKISEFSLFFATIANLGIFGNMVRRLSLEPKNGALFGNALLLRLASALLFFAVGGLYAFLTIDDRVFLIGTLFFMSSLTFDFLTTVCDALLQAHYKMGRATFALLAGRALNFGLILFLSHEGIGAQKLELFLLGPLAGSLLALSLSLFFCRQLLKPKWQWNFKLALDLLWTSLPFGIINILNSLTFRFVPSGLLSSALPDAQFGVYTLSLHLASTLSILSTLFMFSVLPELEADLKEKNHMKARKLYANAKKFLALMALGLVVFGTWMAPWMLSTVSNTDFTTPETWFILPLLLVLAAVSYFYDLALLTLFALKKELWWLRREILALGLCLLFGLPTLFIEKPGLESILIISGAIVAEALLAFWGMRKIQKHFNSF